MVTDVLAWNSLRDGLSALEAAGGIEVGALFTGMQFEATLRTLAEGLGQDLQNRTALRAAGDVAAPRHLDGPRAERILFFGRPFARALLLLFAAVHVSGLTVFSVRHDAPPRALSRHA